ncbi:MAG: hypothetical protein AAFN93_04170 [Bacteroidota bacterium]
MDILEKYPDEYFSHWIAVQSINFQEVNEENTRAQITMYKEFEGEDEFAELQREVETIVKNNDLEEFVEIAKDSGALGISIDDLTKMSNTIMQG